MITISLGLILGLLSGTITESFGHKFFGHPSAWQLKLYFKCPKLFYPMLKAYYHHSVIHHEHTFKENILQQFKNEEDKQKVDAWIRNTFSKSFSALIFSEQYNLTLKGISGILPFALPFTFGPILIFFSFGKVAFFASLVTAYTPVLMSKYIHPLVHVPLGLVDTPWIAKKISRTTYMKKILQNHFLHHKYLDTNFNLLLGGDKILGLYRQPTDDEKIELEDVWKQFKGIQNNEKCS